MSHNFSIKELLKIRKRKAKASPSNSLTAEAYKQESDVLEVVDGDTVLKRLNKYAHVRSLATLPQVEANKLYGVVGGQTIAVCLVIVDKLNHEHIWRRWMEQGAECGYKATLHIHAKYPEKITSPWVRNHTLSHSFLPEWNSPEVIRAVLAVITDAIQSPDTGRLILGTESCMPIRTLKETGDMLFAAEESWLQAYHKAKHSYEEHKCFWAVDRTLIPQEYVWKSLPGWVMLTRKHAESIVSLPEKVKCPDFVVGWNIVYAPEEVYFSTMLALLGFLRDPSRGPDEVRRQCSTFSEWKKVSDANPVTYEALTPELLRRLRDTGAVVARKFRSDTVHVDDWDKLVRNATGDGKSDDVNQQPSSSLKSASSSGEDVTPFSTEVSDEKKELGDIESKADVSCMEESSANIDEPTPKKLKTNFDEGQT